MASKGKGKRAYCELEFIFTIFAYNINPIRLCQQKAGLCFQDKGDSVALTGTVEVVTDEKMKQELWQDWFIEHFHGGPTDPGYVLLKFESNHATYWIEGTFIHKKLD